MSPRPQPYPAWALSLSLALGLSACAPTTRVILLPQPEQPNAAVQVQSRQGQTVLAQPYAVAEVDTRGQVDTTRTTAQNVNQRHRQLLSVQPAPEQRFTLNFEPGGAQLTAESNATLTDVLARASARPGGEIIVTGHTDRVGSVESNDALSLRRAQAVRQLFIEHGFDPQRVQAVGRGEREPAVPTDDETEEPRNRRADIIVR